MPSIPTSEIPRPRSWDEFEDIVWNLYSRLWQDPYAQRNGRSGQRQNGVDIYGQPCALGERFAGIQCKRYEDGMLNEARIREDTTDAEEFSPPLAEYAIVTSEHRDSNLQEFVRNLRAERQAEGKFPVYVTFWEDVCSLLAGPANRDVLMKYYGDWIKGYAVFSGEASALPYLALKIYRPDDRYLHDEITIVQSSAPHNTHWQFGLALVNEAELTVAERIGIHIRIFWAGNEPESKPQFFVDAPPSEGWVVDIGDVRSGDNPAILTFKGSDQDRCFSGQEIRWSKFRLRVAGRMQGSFQLCYKVSTASPLTQSEGELRITFA